MPPVTPETERRRLAKVVHDERGNASVRWHDAPADEPRHVLEIVGSPGLKLKTADNYDPYARGEPKQRSGPARPTDLRRLSEWIKMMRELEARKSQADNDD